MKTLLFIISSTRIMGGAACTCVNQATAGLIGLGSLIVGFLILIGTIQYDMKS